MLDVNYLLEIKNREQKFSSPCGIRTRDPCGTKTIGRWPYRTVNISTGDAVHIHIHSSDQSSNFSVPVLVHFATNVEIVSDNIIMRN